MEPSLVPLAGGWSGETFMAEVAGERTVVRIYGGRSATRGPGAPELDAAVISLVSGLLPVPRVLDVRRGDPDTGTPGLLVTSFEAGVRGDLLLAGLDGARLRRAGESLGAVAGALATMPMLRAAPFVDSTLRLGSFGLDADLAGMVETRAEHLGWSREDLESLVEVATTATDLLDEVPRRSLVHGDLNAKNVLLDPETLQVRAVLDWEFAHAGHPAADLGNLLRLDRQPPYVAGVLAAYAERVPEAERGAGSLLTRARAADLPALVDLAVRRGENPVAEAAHDRLLAIARSGDLSCS